MAPLRIRIIGERLPGRSFGSCGNVHVGMQRGQEIVELVPGDAPTARFEVDIVRRDDDGDYRGPWVHGKPGERFLYLVWADVDAGSGTPEMFSRIKVMLADVPPGL